MNRFHDVRDYLSGIVWDGETRLDSWLTTYLSVPATDYVRNVGRWWMVSAVARAMNPGCKVDYCLILEGSQGLAKTSALRTLAGKWFSDGSLGDLQGKEAGMQLQGTWIMELPEGSIFGRSNTADIKGFITKQSDDYIPKHSNRKVKVKRQNVFALTINETSDYLMDPTGNRRWWPVRVGQIQIAELERDRDQLWAEALHALKAGERWWPATEAEEALCGAEQRQRAAEDPWEGSVRIFLQDQDKTTVSGILTGLGVEFRNQGRRESTRITAILRKNKWVEGTSRTVARYWVRGPEAEPVQEPPFNVEEHQPRLRLVQDIDPEVEEAFASV